MIQYKLIKEYPGSPEIGSVVTKSKIKFFDIYCFDNNNHTSLASSVVENHPEYWQKVEELDYEILSFIYENGYIVTLRPNGKYVISTAKDGIYPGFSLKEQLEDNGCDIHSIKRLSDGEVFTIGDKVRQVKPFENDTTWVIKEFSIKDTRCFTIGVNITCVEKLPNKTPLFTTEDGVAIFWDDSYFSVRLFYFELCGPEKNNTATSEDKFKTFSTKEKAEEYILLNKPCLSLNDLLSVYESFAPSKEALNLLKATSLFKHFEKLAKSKL